MSTLESRVGWGVFGVMNNGMMDEIMKTDGEWNVVAENIMFALINRGEPFSADGFFSLAVKASMPPSLIKKFSGAMFRQFQGAGYIRKRADYVLSQRNGAACLPLWQSASAK